jgi:ribulose-5-phosphate 4-epimerase/fuculose-1-phosphate aldolase
MCAKEELPMKSLHVLQALIAGWFALTCAGGSSHAQTPAGDPAPASGGPVDPALIEDLVIANRVLAGHGVLDAFGHVSIRHPGNADRFLMSRSLAPALVTAADLLEYDLDGNAVDARGRASFLERFIHAEIYKARPDVKAVIHSHSPSVIPFGTTQVPMQPMFHISAFLSPQVPVFEIRKVGGMTDMLVSNAQLGKALAEALGRGAVVLMRGHGMAVAGPSLPLTTFRAIYTEVNARLQTQAIEIGGPITFLAPEESEKSNKVIDQIHLRAWDLWKLEEVAKSGK